jgi:hypothetical protein
MLRQITLIKFKQDALPESARLRVLSNVAADRKNRPAFAWLQSQSKYDPRTVNDAPRVTHG